MKMPRPSKIKDLLRYLSFDKDGYTWKQLLGTHKGRGKVEGKEVNDTLNFPRQTLDRHLKTLIKNGIVEKTFLCSGRKGRPTGKYKLIGYWEPNSLFGGTVPNMIENEKVAKDEKGHWLLTSQVRDSSPRIGEKKIKKKLVVGDYFEKVSDVLGDMGLFNPYKEKASR
jgi:predicted transcriptional regulator